jgi:DNA-binding NarL/FixJ family response regulator
VLIVEDTDHVRDMLRSLMELQGFEVAGEASTGAEVLALVGTTPSDVVVMDYRLPDINGLEATRRLRAEHPDKPVILYSAYADATLEERAREAGVAAVVPKVAGVEALAREIAAVALTLGGDDPTERG